MSRLNPEGVRFVHKRTRPLDVDSMEKAAAAISRTIASMLTRATPVNLGDPDERLAYSKHLAWVIGFDAMIEDRNAIHEVTKLVVEE
jgi:hypothetical protein